MPVKLAGQANGFLCSFPKSGRTWLRFALGRYLSTTLELDLEIDLTTIWRLLPNYDYNHPVPGRDVTAYRYGDDDGVPLIVFTHRLYEPELFGETPVVYLLRSPYDVFVSNYFHLTRSDSSHSGPLKSFLGDREVGVPAIVDHWNSWAPRLAASGDLSLAYEELRADPAAGLSALCAHFGLPADADAIADAVEYSSVDNMRRIELERGIINQRYDQSDPEALRVRKAKVGGYRDYLDDEDIEFVRRCCEERISDAARRLLQDHGLTPWLSP